MTVQHVLALITRLKQICNFDPLTQQSVKLDYLEEQLDELVGEGNKALVFSQYPNKTLTILEPKLKRFGPAIFHGGLSYTARDRLTEDFQNLETPKVLLMSVKAGGTGITLTRANHVFHFDLWWNPAVARQAEGRAHRIGQEQTVFVTSLFTRDTIEERIYNLLERKQALFDEVIEGLSDRELRTSLTEDELFGLFGLTSPKASEAEVVAPVGDIADLTPREFEHLVAALFEAMGFETRTTSLSRDQGIDVYAKRRTDTGWQSLIIQCKHYQSGQVGPGPVRELFGVLNLRPDVSEAWLVTSGLFTSEARRFAKQTGRMRLIDRIQLRGLLAECRLA